MHPVTKPQNDQGCRAHQYMDRIHELARRCRPRPAHAFGPAARRDGAGGELRGRGAGAGPRSELGQSPPPSARRPPRPGAFRTHDASRPSDAGRGDPVRRGIVGEEMQRALAAARAVGSSCSPYAERRGGGRSGNRRRRYRQSQGPGARFSSVEVVVRMRSSRC